MTAEGNKLFLKNGYKTSVISLNKNRPYLVVVGCDTCLDTVWQQHSELGRSKHQGSTRNLHVLDAGSLQIWTRGRLTVGTIPSVKPPESLHNMEIKQTGICTKIKLCKCKQTKKQCWRIRHSTFIRQKMWRDAGSSTVSYNLQPEDTRDKISWNILVVWLWHRCFKSPS